MPFPWDQGEALPAAPSPDPSSPAVPLAVLRDRLVFAQTKLAQAQAAFQSVQAQRPPGERPSDRRRVYHRQTQKVRRWSLVVQHTTRLLAQTAEDQS